ncbi:MAG: hypothetical protein IAE67_09765 [Candidatus Competibacteraceae bacterium]|nr:hypothetical protein [Candidatus Competibacteraceae bacterium]
MKSLINIQVKHPVRWALMICFAVGMLQLVSIRWWGDNWKHTITSDAFGYYTYLPSLFIYNDFQYTYAQEVQQTYHKHNQSPFFFAPSHDGILVNKYYAGTAICMAPFFFVAHVITIISGGSADGFSFWYQVCIAFGTLCYALAGLFLLSKLMRIKKYSPPLIAFVLVCIFLCTNLFYYTVHEAGMSHAYSFFFISLFLYAVMSFCQKQNKSILLLLGFSLGMIVVIRPANILIITALPFLFEDLNHFSKWIRNFFSRPIKLFFPILLMVLPVLIQSGFYFLQSGRWWVYSYQGEYFDFTNPQIFASLFSAERGIWVWTPWLLLLIPSVIHSFIKCEWQKALRFVFFFILLLYVLSSWHIWYYGGGFGLRPYIDYYPVFALMIISWLQHFFHQPLYRRIVILFSSLCLFLNHFQQYQYRIGIIPYMNTTPEGYRQIFLQTGKQFRFIMSPDKAQTIDTFSTHQGQWFINHFDGETTWNKTLGITSEQFHSPPSSVQLHIKNWYSPVCTYILPDTIEPITYAIIRANFFQPHARHNTQVVLSVENQNKDIILWKAYYVIHQLSEKNKWIPFSHVFYIPEGIPPGSKIEVYFYKRGRSNIYIDDMQVGFY